jgi:hypothetical protein
MIIYVVERAILMKTTYKNSLEYKVLTHLHKMRSNVVLRRDLNELGSCSQLTRVLKKLVTEKKLVKISFGIYAKAYISKYTDTPLITGGIDSAFHTALKKLNVRFEPGSAEKEYAAGLTNQIPAKKVIRLKSRCRRRIKYGKVHLIFERNINTK